MLFGWSGVDLFFVLSGYLIANKLFEDVARTGNVRIWAFYLNRVFRILPAYLVAVHIRASTPALNNCGNAFSAAYESESA